ncbi:kinase-like domain-containing protein [Collybia nuda]|uniref:Kinase-like domain-containing protein n=1 Tax=Collybia nuda TaxID=64659 RepID=A0A9P6CEB4_9AGAR|nr:kinase-like domain-containing protein [Collybia nuda]
MAYTLKLDTHLRDLTSEIERISEWHTTGGGFAVLHIAHWRNNGGVAKVGIKVIKVPVQYGRSAKIIADKRLRKEILVWSHLEHPNVLPLLGITYGFGAAGTYGMVCPWIDNGDLSHYLKLHNTLILSERLIMLRQIADAIYYLHSNLVIHGDLTGNNILVAEDGHMLLCDFGLSSLNEDYSDTIYQTSSSPKYNLPWAAPEIVLSEFPLRPSQSTDVYSFGSVIYQVLTGTRPYIGMAEGMICLLLNDRGFPPRPESGFVSDELWALMLRCWKRNPGERPTSIDIRKFLYSMPA